MISTMNRAFIFLGFGFAFHRNYNQVPIGKWLNDLKREGQPMKVMREGEEFIYAKSIHILYSNNVCTFDDTFQTLFKPGLIDYFHLKFGRQEKGV